MINVKNCEVEMSGSELELMNDLSQIIHALRYKIGMNEGKIDSAIETGKMSTKETEVKAQEILIKLLLGTLFEEKRDKNECKDK